MTRRAYAIGATAPRSGSGLQPQPPLEMIMAVKSTESPFPALLTSAEVPTTRRHYSETSVSRRLTATY